MSVGPPAQTESTVAIIRNIEALASRAEAIRYHLVNLFSFFSFILLPSFGRVNLIYIYIG